MNIIGSHGKNQGDDIPGKRNDNKGLKEISFGVLEAKQEDSVTSWFPEKKNLAHKKLKKKKMSKLTYSEVNAS